MIVRNRVITGIAVEGIIAEVALDGVIAIPATDDVRSGLAVDLVVAAEASDAVITESARQRVGKFCTGDRCRFRQQHCIASLDQDLVVIRCDGFPCGGRERAFQQQCRKQLPFIPRCVAGVEQPIQVMAQLLGEHRQGGLSAGRLQPGLIEVDRAGGHGIGPGRAGHGAGGQHRHGWQISPIAGTPALDQLPQPLRFSRQPQRILSCPAKDAVERPLCEQQAPILKEGSEKSGGHGVELEFGLNER